ncbi:NmrA family transcriptional regulator [Gilvimarinus sp. SDUM040013]|uniref:NmrA family transcriptional regulator n=1 Tax=Gilvimarinus gilvus TaxID=3058038 RepID=A0ABU4RV01_9GAMM|nr:NmrA family transcriptional regulator [Gilvimarinus sp. SDUM040013]MDO3387934.1 NmrA family transcriptional regulator [Gilvimarinus sp. SDUM040013]MDX6848695.1 NmrA family transcriptional regulator [Gilvimarinus sp. SDUM040013]
MTTTSPILIIGKNGKTGARVNALLQHLGLPTRAVSRSTTPSFDWNNSETWAGALHGIKQAYVTYQPDLAVPNAEPTLHAFVEATRQAGVEHLVLLSGRGEDGAIRAENVLKESGLTWNIVRASWFFQNFSESFIAESVRAGELALPVGDVLEPFVDCDDIAEVAVAALTRAELANQLFEVTGAQLMTFADCVAMIAKTEQRQIRYQHVPLEPYMAELKNIGLSDDELWLLRELFTQVLDGRNSHVSHGIEQALGRPPKRFIDYVQNTFTPNIHQQTEPA